MPRKKSTPPAETPENKTMNPSPEAETPEVPPAPPAPPQVAEEAPAPAAPEEADETTPEGRRAVVRSPKGLNLRVGPALSYDALEVLPDGMEVLTLALPRGVTVLGWDLVDTGDKTGWCSARFLRPLED